MIVQMKRMTLVAHKDDEAQLLQALQATQAVEILEGAPQEAGQAALEQAE
jgi:vacuolar-type H+-ATPase subunit I/STV1